MQAEFDVIEEDHDGEFDPVEPKDGSEETEHEELPE